MGGEWKIGDPIEVEKIMLVDGPAGWEECAQTKRVWLPATVCGLSPLCVAYANHQREALHGGISVRRPEPATPPRGED